MPCYYRYSLFSDQHCKSLPNSQKLKNEHQLHLEMALPHPTNNNEIRECGIARRSSVVDFDQMRERRSDRQLQEDDEEFKGMDATQLRKASEERRKSFQCLILTSENARNKSNKSRY